MKDPGFLEKMVNDGDTLPTVLSEYEIKVLIDVLDYMEVYIEVFFFTFTVIIVLIIMCIRRTFMSGRRQADEQRRQQ